MNKRYKKKCKHCKHVSVTNEEVKEDFTFIPKSYECVNPDVTVKFMNRYNWDVDKMAEFCKHFNPKKIKECSNCGREINKPAWSWRLWVENIFGNVPVCSLSCQKTLDSEIKSQLEHARQEGELKSFMDKGHHLMGDLEDFYYD